MTIDTVGLVTLLLVNLGVLVAADVALIKAPRSGLAAGLAGAALLVTIMTTAVFAKAAWTDPSVGNLVTAVIWLATLALAQLLYRRQVRISARSWVYDLRSRRWVPARPFIAALFPIGVPTTDGRPGLLAGAWVVPDRGAPVWIEDDDVPGCRRIIGRLDEVWPDKEMAFLIGAGVIAKGFDLSGRMPEVEIQPEWGGAARNVDMSAAFDAGRIVGVRMGDRPAFTGLWVRWIGKESS